MEDAPPPATDLARFARAHDPDRFLCALFAPAARRGAIFALIAFNHELARAREATTNPVAALIRLQWWRDAVEEAAAGKPARRHEVATPLAAAIQAGLLDPAGLLAMADAREAEAEEDALATEPAFVAWLRGTAGRFGMVTRPGGGLSGNSSSPFHNDHSTRRRLVGAGFKSAGIKTVY
jgi:phytoene synthase